ncbi:MAG: hypothetical protein WBX26_04575 [Candidatus Cybelea sp.]
MKISSVFAFVVAVGAAILVVSGCGSTGPAPITSPPQGPPDPTPPANLLYVDHNGTFYAYRLPLHADSKPERTLTEWPGLGLAPAIAVGPYGDVAVSSSTEIRIFRAPIVSFEPSHVDLSIPLTPAITEINASGNADLVDTEYDPNDNLWLFNNIGAEISELRTPFSEKMQASVQIGFGQPGSKAAGYTNLGEGRFDVNATLYVYASNAAESSRLFKIGFPYAKPPGTTGLNLDQADFVDASQYLPTAKNPADLLLGQYVGALRTPKPGSPPSPPVDVMSQFYEPLQPTKGLIPNEHVNTVVGALIADPPRELIYTLQTTNGELDVYGLPLGGGAKPVFALKCLAGASSCSAHEHLFLAP